MPLTIGIPYSDCPFTSAIPCTCEEEALAIAVGASLGGEDVKVFMQNSGFGRCVDIITSLIFPYDINGISITVANRKEPSHHRLMGELYPRLCKELKRLKRLWAEYKTSVLSARQG